jgi:hypothetical protein
MRSRRCLPFLVVLIPAILILVWYIQRTYINTVYLDAFIFDPLIDQFLNGNSSLNSLFIFGRFGEHLIVGYGILSLLNAKFLALDMRLDPFMFLVASTVSAAIVYAECIKVFSNVRSIILGLIFLPLSFLCFSLVAPPLMNMSTQFVWGSTVAFLIAWFMEHEFHTATVDRPRWPLMGALILIPVYFLLFSGAYFPGLVLGLGAMYFFHGIFTGKWFEHRIALVAMEGAICVVSYGYYMLVLPAAQQAASAHGFVHYFTDPMGTLLFYISGIGSSLMDLHTLESAPSLVLVVGGIMVGITLVALWLYIHTGMYLKTYLPVYCIFYSLGIMTAVRVGRGLFGDWGWITNEWYSFHLRFFAIGVVWILIYVLVDMYLPSKPAESAG